MPRKTALEALERFRRDGAWSRQVLNSLAGKNRLDGRDAALAARLFYGVLQNLTLCDFYIALFAKGKLEPKVRDILRLGVYQIVFMDRVPVRAAVSQSVLLCKKGGYDRASGLVNAVLRRIGEHINQLPEPPGEGTAEYLSVKYSHPLWIAEELIGLRGYEGAEAVLMANNAEVPVYIQTNTLKTTPEQLLAAVGGKMHDSIPGCILLENPGDITKSDAFCNGWFYVQDPAAHMAVSMADIRPGMRVLDTCSAPGGKSFAAAIAMENTGEVLSRDISGNKLNLVMDGADRLGLSVVETKEGDAREISGGDYDVVIADVPCSGLGVIRKKPDIRFRTKEELDSIPELQEELLESIATAVKPGGVLLYSTCTWRERENQGVTERFLAAHPEFIKEQERTFWPDLDGTDGFYVCRMKRKDET